jgi:hypothetical protein
MNYILAAGYDVTNDLSQIDVFSGVGGVGDFDGDGAVDLADFDQFVLCYTGDSGDPVTLECEPGDFDGDGDIDCDDWVAFTVVWTDPGDPPLFEPCIPTVPSTSAWGVIVASMLLLVFGTVLLRVRPGPLSRRLQPARINGSRRVHAN